MTSPYPPSDQPGPEQGGAWPPPAQPQNPPPQYPYVPDQPQPPTQQFPPQYPAPQYPVPQYPAPQYQAPQYQAPQQQPPQYQMPQYPEAPQYPPVGKPVTQYPPQYPPPGSWDPGTAPYGPIEDPPEPKSGVGKKIISVVTALVLIGVVIVLKVGARDILDRIGLGGGDDAAPSTVAPPTGPFEDTPAAAYPEGEAGIVLPPAAAVPGFTEAQVAAGLENVKKAMIAARLDPKMLVSHDTAAFVDLFAPEDRDEVKGYFAKPDFFTFATHVAPGQTLTDDKIRVKGAVTFKGATEQGVRLLEVITNFVWIYPFTGELKEPGDHLVVIHDEITWIFPAEADVDPPFRGMYLDGWEGYASNMDCDLLDQSLVALGKPRFVPGASPDDDDAAFDPSQTLNITDTC